MNHGNQMTGDKLPGYTEHNEQGQGAASQGSAGGGFMSKLKGMAGGGDSKQAGQHAAPQGSSGGGFMSKMNEMGGGGQKGERDEDILDKAVDFMQEKVLGQGPQNNESAAEQAKDEAISDTIRNQYKKATGKDFPVQDKQKHFGV